MTPNPSLQRACASFTCRSAEFKRMSLSRMQQHRVDICRLFQAFMRQDLASRWEKLASQKPSQWEKIDPWKVWAHFDSSCMDEWRGKFDQRTKKIVWDDRIEPYRNSKVVVFACGHSKPALFETDLASTFDVAGPHGFLEGFVSIIPSKLGLALNHDGEVIVLQRRT
jgi:hypothetical protein